MDEDDNTDEVIGYGAILSSYGYRYDACNNLTKLTCSVLGSSWNTIYTYDDDNRPSTTTLASGKVLANTYDAIGRLQKRTLKQGNTTIHETTLTYVPGNATNKTTGLVATYQNGSDDAYSYTYDDVGNITSITQGSTSISYEYDAANRLTRENNQVTNQTVTYEYDDFGNILNKKVYAYTTGTLGSPSSTVYYAYTNSAWGDQLTSYDGTPITYDSMGNPTTYRGYTMTWRGKQLAGFTNGTKTVSFEYNEDGLRQQKTYNGVETDYYYNGSVLIGMQRGTAKERFSYDASGNVVSVNHNGTEYYYLRNAQGDIVKLIDGSGATVVEYTYDTWGKKVQTTGSLAGSLGLIQPFRYRGYVYDWETGFYYLQSRYYDPTVGRFISADVLLSTGQGVLGHNCYAYCLGNPVGMVDDQGTAANALTGNYITEDGAGGGTKIGTALGYGVIGGAAAVTLFPAIVQSIEYFFNSLKKLVDQAIDGVENYFSSGDQFVYVMVYVRGSKTGQVGYVGRTKDPIKRGQQHEKDSTKKDLGKPIVVASGLSVSRARVLEQLLISTFVMEKFGGQLLNRRREIAIYNLIHFKNDLDVVSDLIAGYQESEILCALER